MKRACCSEPIRCGPVDLDQDMLLEQIVLVYQDVACFLCQFLFAEVGQEDVP